MNLSVIWNYSKHDLRKKKSQWGLKVSMLPNPVDTKPRSRSRRHEWPFATTGRSRAKLKERGGFAGEDRAAQGRADATLSRRAP
jgi:hypothetical protein